MCLSVINLLKEEKPDIVVIEKLNVGRNMVAVRALSKVIGVVYCYSILNDCFYFEIQPSQWRSKLGMQSSKRGRDEYKQLSIEYIKENIGKCLCHGNMEAMNRQKNFFIEVYHHTKELQNFILIIQILKKF